MSKTGIVKYSKDGERFEIIVDSDRAYDYVTGKRTDALSILEYEEVFKDAKKGERHTDAKIMKAFGTNDIGKIAEIMLKNGDIPITTEQRERMMEDKKKQIIDIISRNAIDPRTNAPLPIMRLENLFKELKIHIDVTKSANAQVDSIVEKISIAIPIKFAVVKLEVTVPPEYTNKCFGVLKQYGLKTERWLSNGSMQADLEFPAGLQTEFYSKINSLTQGKANVKVKE